jgi:hypothetical protein
MWPCAHGNDRLCSIKCGEFFSLDEQLPEGFYYMELDSLPVQ